ncbi:zeta toxin family protein [Microbacterium sp. LWH10-1.2]|uniref:zeta toxin family protein n=1 Tax=Microbacterium sp. LWH10-1.2 TaxID=3135255 RepID=UPI003139CA63
MTDAPASASNTQDSVLRSLFDGLRPSAKPTFVLLTGQVGAGAGRAIGSIRAERGHDLVPVSADDLRAFHPRFLDETFMDSPVGRREVAESTAAWLQAALTHARENRLSVILEGAFRSPDVALGVAGRFAGDGYEVELVVVAVREEESLLAATSGSLRRVRAHRPTGFTSVLEHAETFRGTRALVAASGNDSRVNRVSVFGRRGDIVFDERRSPSVETFREVTGALVSAQSERMTSLESAQWLGELRRVTAYAHSLPAMPPVSHEALIELHQMAIQRVVPELPVPAGSEVVEIQQRRLAAELIELRRGASHHPEPTDGAAPVAQPGHRPVSLDR